MTKKKATKVSTKPKVVSWDVTCARFLKAMTELYNDASAPGIVCAFVPDKGFYVSVVRYERAFGEGKRVMFSSYGATLPEALDSVISRWKAGTVNARFMRRTL